MSIDDYPPPDLSHLQPWAQAMARLPAEEERIRRIRADRWIGYPAPPFQLNSHDQLDFS